MAFVIFFACRSWNSPDYDWSVAHRLRYAASTVIAAPLIAMAFASHDESITSERNFFGVLQVLKDERGRRLIHGSTIHGMQLNGPLDAEPTTYYGNKVVLDWCYWQTKGRIEISISVWSALGVAF